MEKTISFDTPAGSWFEVNYKDGGEWFDLKELGLSQDKVESCSGIWKDESVFKMNGDWQLRIPTDVLISLINAMRDVVNDKDTSWWSNSKDLHQRLKGLVK